MLLHHIEYEGFRNLTDGKIDFGEGLNIIIGENGAGKTNLLEAIFFAAYGSSFRTNDEKNMVKFDQPYMRVTGISNSVGSIFYNGTKKLILNGVEKNRLSEYVGWLPVVVMSLNDIWIIRGAPAKRRGFLDWLLIKLDPVYGANLSEYRKVLRQRNCLLQQKNPDPSLIDVYNTQLVNWANIIYDERRRLMPSLKEKIIQKGEEMGLAEIAFEYQSSCPGMHLTIEELKRNESLEMKKGETISGPHRDDIYITINNHPAKNFASEGECRLCALALKFAEAEVIRQKINSVPLLLLDEVTIELDEVHRKKFFEMVKGQAIYATVQNLADLKLSNKTQFSVKRGEIALS
ncbi:MAG: DNA replication and repair protein RecF [candidate division WOR-3 bacterium]